MDVDDAGHIYTVAAFDPGGTVPDPDGGPFRSALFKIGDVIGDTVELDAEALLLATFEGLKVESVAVRADEGELEIFIDTDDENYGGTIRPMPTPAQARPRKPPRWRSGLSPARRRGMHDPAVQASLPRAFVLSALLRRGSSLRSALEVVFEHPDESDEKRLTLQFGSSGDLLAIGRHDMRRAW